ncbi:Uncharacterized protein APZ42_031991 [Daphnia magna]|uniref:Uncharacterized protein n=1 Tax=Daphnia magna TaxID=35525 RepID=A0A164MGB9_9CRUS|nr:Uncharacterized protein APZ42_031991 [Daphnia magna]
MCSKPKPRRGSTGIVVADSATKGCPTRTAST